MRLQFVAEVEVKTGEEVSNRARAEIICFSF
jgi:hypothetical protein